MKANQCRFLLGAVTLFLVCNAIWGQAVSTSQISGVVQDQSGAIIAGAEVQITQTDTALVRTAVSDANGYYVLPTLPVGPYRLQVSKNGFNTYVQTGIVLEVSSNPVLNVTLTVGAVTQEVAVQATAQMVETENNGVGTVVDQQRVEDLPLNGRELTSLIVLAGGANPGPAGDYNSNKNYPTFAINSVSGGPGGALSVAGGLPTGITYLLDGSTHNDPFNNLNLPLPFPDATLEFKLESSSLPAQYGDHADAAVNVVTKSGTNSYHGDLFEFVRNYLFNAREADLAVRDSLKRNQFGGVFGGPIKKDKLFFFVGFQRTIQKSNPATAGNFVPTDLMEGKVPNDPNCEVLPGSPTQCLDFTAVTNPANDCTSAYSATGGATGGGPMRAPFLDNPALGYLSNVAPLSALNQQGLNLATSLPPATSATNPCGSVIVPSGANLNEQLGIGRIDYQVSTRQTIFGRYFIGNNNQPLVGNNILEDANKVIQKNRAQSLALGETYTISQNVINSVHLTAFRTWNIREIAPFFSPDSLGIDDTANGHNYIPAFMGFNIGNGVTGGEGTANPGHFNTTGYQGADDIDIIRGSHQITMGVDYVYALMATVNNRPTNGAWGFNSGGSTVPSVTGLGYGDLLTGNLDTLLQGNPDIENDAGSYLGLYVQDSWKATRHLTLNYGLRWEPYFPFHNSLHHAQLFSLENFDARVGSEVYVNSPAGLIYPGDPGFPGDSYQSAKPDDIAPRLGVVWDPKGDGKMTIRAGYGIFYDSPQMFFDTRYSNNPPFGASIGLTGPLSLTDPWAAYPGGIPFPALNAVSKTSEFPTEGVYVNSPKKSEPEYLEQWNLSLEKQIGSWLFSATYIGSETKHLPLSYEGDPGFDIPGTCAGGGFFPAPYNNVPDGLSTTGPCSQGKNINNRRLLYLSAPPPIAGASNSEPVQNPGVFYSTIGTLDQSGNGNYNGMLLSAQHRLSSNFSVLANWTYSHCLSDAETLELTGPSYLIPGYPGLSYSNCDSDVRHTVNISAITTSPKFSNHLAGAILGGWEFSPIITYRTGTYSTVITGADGALSGETGEVAQQVSTDFYSPDKGDFTSSSCYPSAANDNCHLPGQSGFKFQVIELNQTPGPSGSGIVGAWGPVGPGTSTPCTGSEPTVTVNGGVYACSRPLTAENPGNFEFDMALVRSFPIRESQSIQFRWEVFNVPNHINLGLINTTTETLATNPSAFGTVTTAFSPRIMQFALKYVF
jgi:hypothetical protein